MHLRGLLFQEVVHMKVLVNGDASDGGVHEVIFRATLCAMHQHTLVLHHYMGHMLSRTSP